MRPTIYPIRFEIRLSEEQMAILNKIAKKYHKTVSEVIRDCIYEKWEHI